MGRGRASVSRESGSLDPRTGIGMGMDTARNPRPLIDLLTRRWNESGGPGRSDGSPPPFLVLPYRAYPYLDPSRTLSLSQSDPVLIPVSPSSEPLLYSGSSFSLGSRRVPLIQSWAIIPDTTSTPLTSDSYNSTYTLISHHSTEI